MELNHKQAVNRLKDIQDELERLDERAKDPEKGLTPEDEAYWTELTDEARALDEHRKGLEREADRARIAAATGNTGRLTIDKGSDPVDASLPDTPKRFKNPYDLSEMRVGLSPNEQTSEFRARALSAIETMPATTDARRKVLTDVIERWDSTDGRLARMALATTDEHYVRAFGKIIASSGNLGALDSDEQRALSRAMSLTDASGGYMIPQQLDPSIIITADGSLNPVRQISRVVTASGDVWNGVSSAGVTFSWDGEAAEVGDDAPTLAQPAITIHKAQVFVPISIEALADAQNVAQEVAGLIAFEKDTRESIAFVTGSGTSQPYGIKTRLGATTSSRVTSTTADQFAAIDVYKVDEALPARHRIRASWLAHRALENDIRQFDTSGGASLWVQLAADVPPTLLGRPIYESEAMPSSVSGTNVYSLIFGDFQKYVIADRIGTTVEFIPHLFGASGRPTGQRGWYAYFRVGADAVDPLAFRVLDHQ
jgi:HK97 family phage major capsid protein